MEAPETAKAEGDGRAAPSRAVVFFARCEELPAALVLVAMGLLPLAEAGARLSGRSIPGAVPLVQHLTLWVAFLGAALAARERKLLALATGEFLPAGGFQRVARVTAATIGALVSTLLARGSFDLVRIEREAQTTFGPDLPVWLAQIVLPVAFGVIALRLVWNAADKTWLRALAALGIVAGAVLGEYPEWIEGLPLFAWAVPLVVALVLGAPLFVAIGGAAVFAFLAEGIPAAAVPAESYRMAVSPHLPAIPLFTLTGFLLAEGRVARRLLRLFRAWIGFVPGGTAVVCALLCAFLTVFTGGSGVTILVLGGLLFEALRSDGYGERFSLGLLTASGSLGLLLPPALPLILYGIVAQIPIEHLFVGGILPGVLLIGLIAARGVREGIACKAPRTAFDRREALRSAWDARYEIGLPIVLCVALFGGFATLVESAALTAAYAFCVQVLVRRELSFRRDLPRVLRECVVLVGGVLLILAVALGLTSYLVDAQLPATIVEWVQAQVGSKLVFLLCLNVFLLLVGCTMDIFSATVVVVPLIVPLGAAYGIDPVHLGILFVANLELGYLTPPVGLNLFLAAYRFERPLMQVYRASFPMLLILGLGVLLITYVPLLTTGLVELWFGPP